ncbi:MAG: peptide chain release factor 1 [Clostridia bacterium]|nr:peptide chain release factor 1 [Clostridia bacterium]
MVDKLKEVEARYSQIEAELGNAEVVSDPKTFAKLSKEYKNLSPIIEKYREYTAAETAMNEAKSILETSDDAELKSLAETEYYENKDKLPALEQELTVMLLPRDENDDKNVIIEIRAGAGGEEAALFAAVLYRMYTMYAESQHFKTSVMSANETELGGYREITFMVEGNGAYSRFKFESVVHRVQRVPETESQGRIHTSTVTVAVLPQAEDIEIEIDPSDIIMESCKSSGAGGQHINKTESAVRLTHKPTGIVVECQQERSQLQNREKALEMLKAKLLDIKQTEQNDKIASTRKSQVGTGDRSEKIRTYNYPQNRITDHRIGLSVFNFDAFLAGDIGGMIDALTAADTAEKLKSSEN